jgi:hypothetical protein
MKKLLFLIAVVILTGCTSHDLPENRTHQAEVRTMQIEINVCDSPYNAIPDDTISDANAFQLAMDVIKSLKTIAPFDSIMPVLIVPPGSYIIDRSLKNENVTVDFIPRFGTLQLKGNGIQISNMTFNYRHYL